MAKRRKKVGNDNTKKAAGDSRFSVLTDEKDTYNPFKGLTKEDVVSKEKPATNKKNTTQKGKSKPNPNLKKKQVVQTFDEDITFEDIFSSWENGRSLDNVKKKSKNMKKSTVQGDEDFASVFAKWESSQGIAPKAKKTPPKKSDNYKPTKDFGQLLEQFEGHGDSTRSQKRPDVSQILKRTDNDDATDTKKTNKKQNQKQKTSKVKNLSELPKNYKIISQSASVEKKNKSNNFKNNSTIKFENKNRNAGKEIKNEQPTKNSNNKKEQKFSTYKNNNKSRIGNFPSVNDLAQAALAKESLAKEALAKEALAKEALAKAALAKETLAKETLAKETLAKETLAKETLAKETLAKETLAKEALAKEILAKETLAKENVAKTDHDSKDKKCSWNVDSKISDRYHEEKESKELDEVISKKSIKSDKKKSDFKENDNVSKKSKDYKKKDSSKKRAPFIVASTDKDEDLPSKWNFSDIYRTWSSQTEEDKAIVEAKKLKDKKDSKGISISYLRSMSPQAEIDLHGLTSDVALLKTREFLEQSRAKGLKKVSIITGKGIHSKDDKGVLQDVALSEIRLSGIVREAYNPKAIDGGSGAIWVIFKSMSGKKVYF